MVTLNWIAIIISTVISFAIGAVWHGPIFGKLWMRIHHGKDSFNDAEMKKSMEGMWKLMVTEFVASLLMIIGLACIIRAIPEYSAIQNAFLIWVAFVVPVMTSTVIWGADAKKWMATKVAIASAGRLVSLLIAAYILAAW